MQGSPVKTTRYPIQTNCSILFIILFILFSMTMESNALPSTPTKQTEVSRDTRLKIQVLRDIGWKYSAIANQLKITIRQVQYACNTRPTPQKQLCGRKPTLDAESRQLLVSFVCASSENRQTPYWQIPWKLGWNVSEEVIRRELKKEDFARRIARRKPSISEINRLCRLA